MIVDGLHFAGMTCSLMQNTLKCLTRPLLYKGLLLISKAIFKSRDEPATPTVKVQFHGDALYARLEVEISF